jgi:hypothetical protein
MGRVIYLNNSGYPQVNEYTVRQHKQYVKRNICRKKNIYVREIFFKKNKKKKKNQQKNKF